MAKNMTTSAGHGRGEQREAPRRAATWDAEASLGDEPRRVRVGNISEGGLMFSTSAPARVPATMDVRLALPDGGHITLTSSVRHVARRAGAAVIDVGVQFDALDPAAKSALDSALASLPPS
ncbi:MAG TPA: PilZ domain-containing protein [Kofleriaceae bacterium]|nr:PilZ domain-containing protein [Kofleriaceae bacterium]